MIVAERVAYRPLLEDLIADVFFEMPFVALERNDRDVVDTFVERAWDWFEENGHEGCQPAESAGPTELEIAWNEGVDAAIELTRRAYKAAPYAQQAIGKLGKALKELRDEGRAA